jgi:hypothetical protein
MHRAHWLMRALLTHAQLRSFHAAMRLAFWFLVVIRRRTLVVAVAGSAGNLARPAA